MPFDPNWKMPPLKPYCNKHALEWTHIIY
jgi:hypothetical protein